MTMSEDNKPKKLSDLEKDIIAKKMVAIMLVDPLTPITVMAEQFGISRHIIGRIKNSEFFQNMLQAQANHELGAVIETGRNGLAKLVSKAIKVVEARLDDNDLEAAKTVFRAVGIERMEEKPQDTNITVVLPGGINEKVIEVKESGEPFED